MISTSVVQGIARAGGLCVLSMLSFGVAYNQDAPDKGDSKPVPQLYVVPFNLYQFDSRGAIKGINASLGRKFGVQVSSSEDPKRAFDGPVVVYEGTTKKAMPWTQWIRSTEQLQRLVRAEKEEEMAKTNAVESLPAKYVLFGKAPSAMMIYNGMGDQLGRNFDYVAQAPGQRIGWMIWELTWKLFDKVGLSFLFELVSYGFGKLTRVVGLDVLVDWWDTFSLGLIQLAGAAWEKLGLNSGEKKTIEWDLWEQPTHGVGTNSRYWVFDGTKVSRASELKDSEGLIVAFFTLNNTYAFTERDRALVERELQKKDRDAKIIAVNSLAPRRETVVMPFMCSVICSEIATFMNQSWNGGKNATGIVVASSLPGPLNVMLGRLLKRNVYKRIILLERVRGEYQVAYDSSEEVGSED
jgi:hypothetical protein